MLIASAIVKVEPELAGLVVERIEAMDELTTYGVHKESNVIAVMETETVEELEALSRHLLETVDGVLAVFPTYITSEEAVTVS